MVIQCGLMPSLATDCPLTVPGSSHEADHVILLDADALFEAQVPVHGGQQVGLIDVPEAALAAGVS